MYDNKQFNKLVASDHPTGEVVRVNRYLVTVKGLDGCPVGALVVFENGNRGIIREMSDGKALVLNCDDEATAIGSLVVLQDRIFSVGVGKELIGRVVDAFGRPLDSKGALTLNKAWPIFNTAPGISERSLLKDQLYSGVTMVDMMFPVVLGQRIAVLGDTKSGKSTFLLQLGANQAGNKKIFVYVLIGKRRAEVDQVIETLTRAGMLKQSIIVVADIFSSLAQSYIAPYAGCAMAEYLWHNGYDTVIVYDDLSTHAKIYREISLLSEANPGRDSYPGDMFYAHSSLLERAGKLSGNGKTLTALPVVLTPSDDITAYLPTNVMSITDGQLIFDLATFRQNVRPALNAGLSVSRVGGRAQTPRQKQITQTVFKLLADFRQAQEFSHFGSELSNESRQILIIGQQLQEAFRQFPTELYSSYQQELILGVIIMGNGMRSIDIAKLKKEVKKISPSKVSDDKGFERAAESLLRKYSAEVEA